LFSVWYCRPHHRALHSSPTRRSSDLCSRSNRWPMTEPAPICDQPGDLPVSHSRTVHQGAVFDLVSEQEDLGSAGVVQREFLSHRSEEHTSELQSRFDLVCRLLLEKKK